MMAAYTTIVAAVSFLLGWIFGSRWHAERVVDEVDQVTARAQAMAAWVHDLKAKEADILAREMALVRDD